MSLFLLPVTDHAPTPWKLGIITGRSDPATCMLSQAQTSLLQRLVDRLDLPPPADQAGSVLWRNFPFTDSTVSACQRPSLLRASLANARQYCDCRTAAYEALARPHWQRLFDSADRFFLLTGSCGLELLVRGLRSLRETPAVQVLALGPVANRRLVEELMEDDRLSLQAVYGSRDWIATRNLSRNDVRLAKLGHLDYWVDARVEKLACEWLSNNISELLAQAATCRPVQ